MNRHIKFSGYNFKLLLFVVIFCFLVLFFAAANKTSAVPTSDLVGWWKLDESSGGTASDSSGHGNDGSLIDGSWLPTGGQIDGALDLGGSDDYVDIPHNSSFDFGANQDFTVSVWVKSTQAPASGQYPMIFSKGTVPPRQGYNLILHASDEYDGWWFFEIFADNNETQYVVFGNSNVADGTWHLLTAVRSGNTILTYEDDKSPNSETDSLISATVANNYPINIGRMSDGYWNIPYNGLVDDARVYNRALSQAEITELYVAGGGAPPDPFREICLDEGIDTGTSLSYWVTSVSPPNSSYDFPSGVGNYCGYDGDYYVTGTSVAFTAHTPSLPEAGQYQFTFNYNVGNPGQDYEDFTLTIGGQTFTFLDADLKNTNNWEEETVTVNLNAGENNFTFQTTGAVGNSAHFEAFRLTPVSGCTATETVGLVRQNCTGYSNCYTSLAAWQAAYGGVNFGSCAQGDLVCANKIAVAKIDGAWSSADTQPVNINNWTTDACHYINIYTTAAARHSGKWDDNKYRINSSVGSAAILIQTQYVRVDGVQATVSANDGVGIGAWQSAPSAGDIRISNSIIKGTGPLSEGSEGIGITNVSAKVWNNLIYDINSTCSSCVQLSEGLSIRGATVYASNNTIYNITAEQNNHAFGFLAHENSSLVLKNNLVYQSGDNYATEDNGVMSGDNNLSGLPPDSDMPSAGARNGVAVNFIDEAGRDLHLNNSDIGAKDYGVDLSGNSILSFNTDIDGQARPAGPAWDIGADESGGFSPGACSSSANVSGWAWSSNIGWISFNCSTGGGAVDYGVNIDPATGNLSGYGWSDNIGWISFNRADANNPPSAPFNGGAGPIAKLDFATGLITGWMRTLSACGTLPCPSSLAGPRAGGWDGWIKLCDSSTTNCFGDDEIVKVVDNAWRGWSWTDLVAGWISFNCLTGGNCATSDYKVIFSSPFSVINLSDNITADFFCYHSPEEIILSWDFSDPDATQTSYEIQVNKDSQTFDRTYASASQSITGYAINQDAEAAGLGIQFIWYNPDGQNDQNYTWRIKVWDGSGIASSWSEWANFTIVPPLPNPAISPSSLNPSAGTIVTLRNNPGVPNASWVWNIVPVFFSYENSTGPTSQNPEVTFDQWGFYSITMTVTDTDNNCSCTGNTVLNVNFGLPNWKEIAP